MFKEGDYVVYKCNGLCQVEAVGNIDMAYVSNEKQYYTLMPCYDGGKVFVPVERGNQLMESILTKDEAAKFIEQIKEMEPLEIENEKERERIYKETVNAPGRFELARMIKTIYYRGQAQIDEGKKLGSIDQKYLQMAQERLHGELAMVLEMKKEEVEAYILSCIEIGN